MFAPSLRLRPSLSQQRPFLILITLLTLGFISIIALNTSTNPSNLVNKNIKQLDLPLAFVPNLGQTNPEVQYQAHDLGGTLYFSEKEVVLSLQSAETDTDNIIRLQFVGMEQGVKIHEGNALPGVVNYLIGNQQSAWLTDLPTYGEIVYESLYPGIDLSYDGSNGRLKGTYLVSPGANPGLIQWHHAGANSVTTDSAGNLAITLPNSKATLFEEAPIAWQEINGQRRDVPVSYVIGNNGNVSFSVGQYNTSLPLIIDPTIVFSVTLGGSDIDSASGIAVDSAGNSYITGFTTSTDYPTLNPYQTDKTSFDVFVTKINDTGTGLVYSTYIGGSEWDMGSGIAVDTNGIAYIVGDTDSTDFPTKNPVQSSNGGIDDVFVLALNANGNDLVYSTYLGGSSLDSSDAIALDSSGNVYVTGMTTSSNFPTQNAYDNNKGGFTDAFVTKLNSSGSAWVYSTYLGGSSEDFGFGIAVDGNSAYVVGNTLSTDFPTQNAYQGSNGGASDLFVTKFDSAGTGLDYSTYLGGTDADIGYAIAVKNGQAHVTGYTKSDDYPTQTPIQSTFGGNEDAVVSILSTTGNSLSFSTYLGGDDKDGGRSIAVNNSGDIYLTGETFSSNFPTSNPFQATNLGQSDAFITKISSNALAYSTYLGDSEADFAYGIALDSSNDAYVVGHTDSSNFPGSSIGNSPLGHTDLFVVKIEDAGGSPTTPTPTPTQPTPQPTQPPPTPTPTPTPTVQPTPGGNANLSGSSKHASHFVIGPNTNLTYSIRLHNSGSVDTTADVSDAIPTELDYVAGSVTGGGSYDAGTHTITWSNVTVASGQTVTLEFDVTHNVSSPVVVVNTAEITPAGGNTIDRSMVVLLKPTIPSGDFTPPVVNNVVIGSQDILTNATTSLTIDATDNVDVTEMYITEWQITSAPLPIWQKVQSTGWIPYQSTYPWTLESESGVHYITVWAADAEGNISFLTPHAADFASLILPNESVSQGKAVPYLVKYDAGKNVSVTLTPSSGDADLYVWYPNNFGQPDHKSINTGTAVDSINFTTSSSGTYLILVYGHFDSTYDLTIIPAGGPTLLNAVKEKLTGANIVTNKDVLTAEPILSQANVDPLSIAETPAASFKNHIYLPIISGN